MNSLLKDKHRAKHTEVHRASMPSATMFFHACSNQKAIQTLSFEIWGEASLSRRD